MPPRSPTTRRAPVPCVGCPRHRSDPCLPSASRTCAASCLPTVERLVCTDRSSCACLFSSHASAKGKCRDPFRVACPSVRPFETRTERWHVPILLLRFALRRGANLRRPTPRLYLLGPPTPSRWTSSLRRRVRPASPLQIVPAASHRVFAWYSSLLAPSSSHATSVRACRCNAPRPRLSADPRIYRPWSKGDGLRDPSSSIVQTREFLLSSGGKGGHLMGGTLRPLSFY